MKNKAQVRQIETFELNSSYYIESYLNGNKSHVKQELAELFRTSPLVAIGILIDFPKPTSSIILESKEFQSAVIHYRHP